MTNIQFIRPGHTFVIAEAGVNHNGQLELAHKLIDVAAEAGADAVKFQTFRAEGVATSKAPKAQYQIETTGTEGTQLDMIRALELSDEYYPQLIRHADDRGITFLSTPHDWEAIDILDNLDVIAYKIGSGDLTNLPFLRRVAGKGRPIILSTGMGNIGEVEQAVQEICNQGNDRIILLHCVTSYPADMKDVNLRAMSTLGRAFGFPVGYSDHTLGSAATLAAVALGAVVIEKHFTLDLGLPGPDHQASLTPQGLVDLVADIRQIELIRGDGIKKPVSKELDIMSVARKSIVANCELAAGTILSEAMITTKRPGTGISPQYWDQLVGAKIIKPVAKDMLLSWDQISFTNLSR